LLPTLIIALLLVVLFTLMAVSWASRRRRQAGLARPVPAPETLAAASLVVEGWYVATTVVDQPLERIAVHGLGFRARVTASVHPEGLVLAVRGSAPFVIEPAALRGVGRATWAIDRVVEKDGLVLIRWTLGGDAVDSYVRLPDPDDAQSLVDAVERLIPPTTGISTGTATATSTSTSTATSADSATPAGPTEGMSS
jgi:hypothetical protein